MLPLAQAGLAVPAVASRGLNEGLGVMRASRTLRRRYRTRRLVLGRTSSNLYAMACLREKCCRWLWSSRESKPRSRTLENQAPTSRRLHPLAARGEDGRGLPQTPAPVCVQRLPQQRRSHFVALRGRSQSSTWLGLRRTSRRSIGTKIRYRISGTVLLLLKASQGSESTGRET